MTESPSDSARGGTVEIIRRWSGGRGFASRLLGEEFERREYSPAQRARITALVNGVIRRKGTLDWLIDGFSAKKPPSSRSYARQILRLAFFELIYMDQSPDYAILHQAGELGRPRLSRRERGYVNAILRKFLRRGKDPNFPPSSEPVTYLAVTHSHPPWLVTRWLKRMDFREVEKLCRTNNTPPPIFIRRNRLKSTSAILEESLNVNGIAWRKTEDEDVYLINLRRSLFELSPFQAGYFFVQDPSTVRIGRLAGARPEERVADLCAAPGGKAGVIAEMMQNRGALLAADISGERLGLLEDNFRRLGIENAEIRRIDLLSSDPLPTGFDRVLADVPCSNTGVLRRRVDARWRLREKDIERLADQGLRLIESASGTVRSGGVLVYSTCSIEPEENREVIDQFLEGSDSFRLEKEISGLPRVGGEDGYYAARLRKRTK